MMPTNSDQFQGAIECTLGATLCSLMFWAHTLTVVAEMVAALCGAIIGIHGVWRLVRHYRGAK